MGKWIGWSPGSHPSSLYPVTQTQSLITTMMLHFSPCIIAAIRSLFILLKKKAFCLCTYSAERVSERICEYYVYSPENYHMSKLDFNQRQDARIFQKKGNNRKGVRKLDVKPMIKE